MDHKKLTIAYHETGHAVMALVCGHKIQTVSLRESDSPRGTGKYLGSTRLDQTERKIKDPINEALQQIRIALAGGVGEGLFADNVARVGEDDMARALEEAEKLLKLDENVKSWIAGWPAPPPGAFSMIQNQLVRSCIVNILNECFEIMIPLKPPVQFIAEELLRREELTGDEISTLFNSFIQER